MDRMLGAFNRLRLGRDGRRRGHKPGGKLETRIQQKRTKLYHVESVKHLRTGGYNKVFKVRINYKGRSQMTIFRFPHLVGDLQQQKTAVYGPNVSHQVALLRWLRERNYFRVPDVLEYDAGHSILGQPYIVLEYLPSTALDNIYHLLPQSVKIQAARCIAEVMMAMLENPVLKAGIIISTKEQPEKFDYMGIPAERTPKANLNHVGFPTTLFGQRRVKGQGGESLRELMYNMLAGWEASVDHARAQGRIVEDLSYPRMKFIALRRLITEMDSRGYFKRDGRGMAIHHWDFWPRNILVRISRSVRLLNGHPLDHEDGYFDRIGDKHPPGQPLIKIAAIVDWDDAAALPAILTRVPPFWLWDPRPAQYKPGRNNGRVPVGADGNDADLYGEEYYYDSNGKCWLPRGAKEIRDEFNGMMERRAPGWHQDAYGRGRWVRRVWRFLVNGDEISKFDADRLTQLISDWEKKKAYEAGKATVANNFDIMPQLQQNTYRGPEQHDEVMQAYRQGGARLQRWQRVIDSEECYEGCCDYF